MPSSKWMPPAASGPVLTVSSPTLTGAFCATAGIGIAAPAAAAAVPARRERREILVVIVCSPGIAWPYVEACLFFRGIMDRPAAGASGAAPDATKPAVSGGDNESILL